MNFFKRRPAPADANTATATATPQAAPSTEKRRSIFGRHTDGTQPTAASTGPEYYNRRPTFGQWIKGTWLDILLMAIMGAIGLGVYNADPAPSRSFPLTFQDGEIVYPEFAYPLRNEIIPIWESAVISFFVPLAVFLLMQIRIRSFWDLNNAIIGLLYSLICAAVFQVFIKWLIGGLRPHFYAVCQPVIPAGMAPSGNGWRQIMYDRRICTGDQKQINDALESMPSGHSTAAFAGLIYLYLYLNAKLKVFSNYHPSIWKLIATYAPVLGACLIAGALTIDQFHNWYDLVAGAIIGTIFAFSAYRMVYASVWDFRFNHIPLARNTPFTYSGEHFGFNDALWTRKAGWGWDLENGLLGAPFDASKFGALAGGPGIAPGAGRSLNGHTHTTTA